MFAELHGGSIYYEANLSLHPEFTPVLFLHGWGCDHTFFRFYCQRTKLPWIAVDFPNHGQSPEPSVPWKLNDFKQQIDLLLKQLGMQKVSIVAHSFGARVALSLAADNPSLIYRMVITGGAGIRKPQSDRDKAKMSLYHNTQMLLNRAKKVNPLRSPVEVLQKKLQSHYASPDYLALSDTMKETFKNIVNEDLSPLLCKNTAPTLLIWGSEDTETPLWMGKKMETEMKDAALIPFEGKSHFAFLEEPERFIIITEPFLKGEA